MRPGTSSPGQAGAEDKGIDRGALCEGCMQLGTDFGRESFSPQPKKAENRIESGMDQCAKALGAVWMT